MECHKRGASPMQITFVEGTSSCYLSEVSFAGRYSSLFKDKVAVFPASPVREGTEGLVTREFHSFSGGAGLFASKLRGAALSPSLSQAGECR